MLFNSVFFITVFLPLILVGWFALQRLENATYAKLFLLGMSLWFYGYYNPWYMVILVGSLVLNYGCSVCLKKANTGKVRKAILTGGILCNVGILFYFKYFNFFIDNCNYFLHKDIQVERIALPLGISFFTFQQLSFIIDRYKENSPHYNWLDYACFVTFFPQLVAGPIVLHSEFLPQLQARQNRKVEWEGFFDGTELFILGLGKKVLLADMLAILVNAEFNNISYLDAFSAWITIICYMLQLYFDFSGYCDMARGMGKMMGFSLPENFNSPLMAVSVTDFWRRWHMTLSRFLTTYIYIPLGGNRKGKVRQCCNIMIVFLVSGFWHGANWTFVVWGVLHGVARVWEILLPRLRFRFQWLNRLFTGLFVTFTFGIFRSDSLEQAGMLIQKLFMGGYKNFFPAMCNVFLIPENYAIRKLLSLKAPEYLNHLFIGYVVLLMGVAIWLVRGKKAEQWMEQKGRTIRGLLCIATIFTWAFISLSQVSTFLYFNF